MKRKIDKAHLVNSILELTELNFHKIKEFTELYLRILIGESSKYNVILNTTNNEIINISITFYESTEEDIFISLTANDMNTYIKRKKRFNRINALNERVEY